MSIPFYVTIHGLYVLHEIAHPLTQAHGRTKQRRGQPPFERFAQGALCDGALDFGFDHFATDVDQMPIIHATGTRRLAVATSQAAIQMGLRGAGGLSPLQDLLDQVNAPARAIKLVTKNLVGWTGRGTKTAVHTLAQNGLRLVPQWGVQKLI